MSCNCVTYQCLEVDYSPCDNDIELPIVADETADWAVQIEFNGTWIRLIIEVTDGENISIPNVLNESYTHTIRLLNSGKELFNDTCYKVKTQIVSGAAIIGGTGGNRTRKETYRKDIVVTGNPQTFSWLVGAGLLGVYVEGDDIPSDLAYDTGIVTYGGDVGAGQTGYILYKK